MLLGRLTTLTETQERDLAHGEAEHVCHPGPRLYNSQIREEMSQEKVGGLSFTLRTDPLGVLIFPGIRYSSPRK